MVKYLVFCLTVLSMSEVAANEVVQSAQPHGRVVRVRTGSDRPLLADAGRAALRLRVEARDRGLPTAGR